MRSSRWIVLLLPLLASPLHACLFCEEGAYDAAIFVGIVFGLSFIGLLMLCIAYWRVGGFATSNQTELTVLSAENVAPISPPIAEDKP